MKILLICVALIVTVGNVSAAKPGLGAIFGALIGAAIGNSAGRAMATEENVTSALTKMCDQINRTLPLKVDDSTRWDKTTPGPGRKLTYNYTIIAPLPRNMTASYFLSEMSKEIKPNLCTSDDLKIFFQNNITIAYSYKQRDLSSLGTIEFTPRDCGYKS